MNASEYLERLAATRPAAPDEGALRALHRAHLLAVPFENLDIHLGRRIRLEPEALFQKIVRERRGGFCYELNGLFGWLLESLGFQVTRLSARVYSSAGALGPEFDHLALRVDLDRPFLCDVGFGEGFLEPLPLQPGDHTDGERAYRLSLEEAAGGGHISAPRDRGPSAEGGGWLYERRAGSERWERQYRFTLVSRRMEEFLPMCHWHQTSPESPFTRRRLCTLATARGRITLSEGRLIETLGVERKTTPVEKPEAEAAVLRDRFGVRLSPDWVSPVSPRTRGC
ncbi:MAG TPA: arylamine N-acetyltransferase [Myxococcaceae bacterium]|jgi:N-hydroxyarylamine O-acetyltransferase